MDQKDQKDIPRLSERKTRKKVAVVGESMIRLLSPEAYKRRLDMTSKIAPWKRQQFSQAGICCSACSWKPPGFLTKTHTRTFLTIHHVLSVADGGNDESENLMILCPNCHSLADYLPSLIVLPTGDQCRVVLLSHIKLLNVDPDEWKRQYDTWILKQKREAVDSLSNKTKQYNGNMGPFILTE